MSLESRADSVGETGGNSTSPPSRDSRKTLAVAFLLGLIVLAVYSSTYRFGILAIDDAGYVAIGDTVSGGLTPKNIAWAFTSTQFDNYFPITLLSFQFDGTLYGTNYGGYHFTNALLHALTAGLLLWFLRLATGSLWRSAVVAALFALHPARVESVAWIAERKDVLSGAFGIASLIAYVYYARRPSVPRMLAVLVLLILGMLSKAMLVTWPAVMLLMDIWPLRRIGNSTSQNVPAIPTTTIPRLLLEKIPLFAASLAIAWVTFKVQHSVGAVVALEGFDSRGIDVRLANALLSYVRYIGMLFWPVDLGAFYPHTDIPLWKTLGSLALLIAVSLYFLRRRLDRPYLLVGWLWFLGTLVPVIGLVQVGLQAIADRYTYLPHVGLLFALVWAIADSAFFTRFRNAIVTLTILLLIIFCVGSWRQSQHWQSNVTLWTRAHAVTTNNLAACDRLARAYLRLGQHANALPYVIEGAQIAPTVERQDTVGNLLLDLKRYDDALVYFRLASLNKDNKPDAYVPHVKLIQALRLAGKGEEAEFVLRQLLSNPHVPRDLVLADLNLPGAIAQYRAHLAANPQDAVARNVLGVALARSGDLHGAIEQFRAALAINPDMSDVKRNLVHAMDLLREKEK